MTQDTGIEDFYKLTNFSICMKYEINIRYKYFGHWRILHSFKVLPINFLRMQVVSNFN